MNTALATGYYGVPGEIARGKVHIHVLDTGRPLCGARLSERSEFQWCAGGVYLKYVICKHCLAKGDHMKKKRIESRKVLTTTTAVDVMTNFIPVFSLDLGGGNIDGTVFQLSVAVNGSALYIDVLGETYGIPLFARDHHAPLRELIREIIEEVS
jgi:hypothetical protein